MKFFTLMVASVMMSSMANAAVEPSVNVTYIGTATMLIEIGDHKPFRILTDPVFDEPGKTYPLGWGNSTKKLHGPAIAAKDLPPIDLVLLSHDEHADNLDVEGRKFLPLAKNIITTVSGADRLKKDKKLKFKVNSKGQSPVRGLGNWKSWSVVTPEGWTLKVTAVPGQHSPSPLLTWISGDVIGFVLEWTGQSRGVTYITGDTVYINALKDVATKFTDEDGKPKGVENLFLHLAAVQFKPTFCLLWTMDGKEGAKLIKDLKPLRVLPLHFDGWSHFHENWATSKAIIEPVVNSLKVTQSIELYELVPGLRTKLVSP